MVKNRPSYAFITGGAARIGRAVALELAKKGYSLVLHYNHSKEKIKITKSEAEALGATVRLLSFNFLKSPNYDELFQDLKNEGIGVEVLINSASLFEPSTFKGPGAHSLTDLFKINFTAAYDLTQAFTSHYLHGSVINFLDTKITKNTTQHFNYLLSKKLLQDFTQMAALELAPHFRVNGIAPGLILPPPGEDEHYLEALAEAIPLKKVGGLTPILQAVNFLLENTFVTGQTLYIDGGDHLL